MKGPSNSLVDSDIKQQDARLEGLKYKKSFLFFISGLVRGATTGKLLDDRLDNNQG